jgi:G8 domain
MRHFIDFDTTTTRASVPTAVCAALLFFVSCAVAPKLASACDVNVAQAHPVANTAAITHVTHGEHAAVARLVDHCSVTHMAVKSGNWSSAETWQNGRLPDTHARAHIPAGITISVDRNLFETRLTWLRVDGTLTFATDTDTSLRLETMVVTAGGKLLIGEVARPVTAGKQARLVFAPRTQRDAAGDPFDLAGGLLVEGTLTVVGVRKTPHVLVAQNLRAGEQRLALAAPIDGWVVGDRLLLAGVNPLRVEDEIATIESVEAGGRSIRLATPLLYDHAAPAGMSYPVVNMTRNVVIESESAVPLAARGHVMIMHQQTGTMIDGAAFKDLGRTDARLPHTIPQLDAHGILKPGTDANSIGRYSLHFHVRSGALLSTPPHIVSNSIIDGSPKYGLVNHGGHVVAEGNASYNIVGSHFVAENGSEVGAFRSNVAIRSSGSDDRIRSRDITYDFGHGGHGFWLQSCGVALTDNWAAGHAEAAFTIFGYPFMENGELIYFDARNASNPQSADVLGRMFISSVNFYAARNTAAGSKSGFEIWNHKIYNLLPDRSRLDGFTGWGFATYGLFVPYTKNVDIRNVHIANDGVAGSTAVGVAINGMTENLVLDELIITGFGSGVQLPQRGRNVLRHSQLRNTTNLEIWSPNLMGRTIDIIDVALEAPFAVPHARQFAMGAFMTPHHGDIAILYGLDHIHVVDAHGDRKRLYFPYQKSDFVPFTDKGPAALRGLTNREIARQYVLAPGGALAPDVAAVVPSSNALIDEGGTGAASSQLAAFANSASTRAAKRVELYPQAFDHFEKDAAVGVAGAWKLVEAASRGQEQRAMVYIDNEPPKFLLMKGLVPLQIHPDDIEYGYRVMGMVVDLVEGQVTMRAHSQEFFNLTIDADRHVRIDFKVADMAGNETEVKLALLVTDQAVRRGQNLNFFVQKHHCGMCGYDTLVQDAEKLFAVELAALAESRK